MIISVLERRSEIGFRRALGATKAQIRTRFLAESILLAGIGGVVGVLEPSCLVAVCITVRPWCDLDQVIGEGFGREDVRPGQQSRPPGTSILARELP